MNMLLRLRAPFTAGKLNCPIDAPFHPPPPPLFWSVLRLATPGKIVNNSVKLRPFKGRSFISLGETTVPSSEVASLQRGRGGGYRDGARRCADAQLKVERRRLANLEGYRRLRHRGKAGCGRLHAIDARHDAREIVYSVGIGGSFSSRLRY